MRGSLFKTFIMLFSFLLINNIVSAGHPPGTPEDWFGPSFRPMMTLPEVEEDDEDEELQETSEADELLRRAHTALSHLELSLKRFGAPAHRLRIIREWHQPLRDLHPQLTGTARAACDFLIGRCCYFEYEYEEALSRYTAAYEGGVISYARYRVMIFPCAWIPWVWDWPMKGSTWASEKTSRKAKAERELRELVKSEKRQADQEREEQKAEAKKLAQDMRRTKEKIEKARKVAQQKRWADDLATAAKQLNGLEKVLPEEKTVIERIQRDIDAKNSWRTLPTPAKNAEQIYYKLMGQITKLTTAAMIKRTKDQAPSLPSQTAHSVVDLASSTKGQTHYIQVCISREAAAREERYKQVREAKLARRAPLQKNMGKENQNAAADIAKEVGVPLIFAKGNTSTGKKALKARGGSLAAHLFVSHGSSTLTDPVETGAAHILSIFSYSRGNRALLKNLADRGIGSHGLNPEYLNAYGCWSIRVNNQYRICFNWNKEKKQWTDVWYGDYH